jgi:hypothetical protein
VLWSMGAVAPVAGSWPVFEAESVLRTVLASLATMTALVLVVVAWRAAVRDRFAKAMVLAIPATILAEIAIFGAWVPSLRWVFNTPRIVGIVVEDSGRTPRDEDFPRIGGVGYQEDSLLFTTRDRLDRLGDRVNDTTRPAIEAWCVANPGGYLLIPRTDAGDFTRFGEVVAELFGFNYSDGDPVAHAVIRIRNAATP